MIRDLWMATLETIYMTIVPLIVAYLIAIPIAFICVETDFNGLFPNYFIHKILNLIIAVGRAIPFVILMIIALPFTRWLLGTGIGTTAVIVPLTICAIPFTARMIESSIKKVDYWVIVAAKVDGASKIKIMIQIEFMSVIYDIIDGIGIVAIAIIGYTTMAGTLGGGGLGNYAIVYGFQRYDWIATLCATLIIVIIVFVIQTTCQIISKRLKRRII